jgi:HEAT repeat protein
MSLLSEQIEQLDSADETERTYAAEDLGYLNATESVPPLLVRLQREFSPVVRDAIGQALIRLDADEAIEGAVRLFESDDAQLRNLGVDVLRHKGDRSIPFLRKAMRDGDRDMRKFVLDVLSGIQARGTADIYAAALSDEDPNVVITAVENIGKLRATEFRRQLEDLLESDGHPMLIAACLEALAEIGNESSLPTVLRRFPELTELPAFFLTPCLKALAALGRESEFAQVAALLPRRAAHICPAILSALIAIHRRCIDKTCGPPELSDAMRAVLESVVEGRDPPTCRYQAARVLGFWTERGDVNDFLVACLESKERLVRLGAAEALRMSERPGLEALLLKHALSEADGEVRPAHTR